MWGGFARVWRREWFAVLGRVLVIFVVTGVVLFPLDARLLEWVRGEVDPGVKAFAKGLGFWGDFLQFNLGVAGLLYLAGVLRRNPWLRRVALAFLIGGALSGATARIVKFSTGRARPSTVEKQDLHWVTFTGPSIKPGFHGYFSGHTAATWGSAVALAILCPRLGWLAVVFAAGVGWSRMYGNSHFPTDVVHGATWGIAWGWLVAKGLIPEGRAPRSLPTRR